MYLCRPLALEGKVTAAAAVGKFVYFGSLLHTHAITQAHGNNPLFISMGYIHLSVYVSLFRGLHICGMGFGRTRSLECGHPRARSIRSG